MTEIRQSVRDYVAVTENMLNNDSSLDVVPLFFFFCEIAQVLHSRHDIVCVHGKCRYLGCDRAKATVTATDDLLAFQPEHAEVRIDGLPPGARDLVQLIDRCINIYVNARVSDIQQSRGYRSSSSTECPSTRRGAECPSTRRGNR